MPSEIYYFDGYDPSETNGWDGGPTVPGDMVDGDAGDESGGSSGDICALNSNTCPGISYGKITKVEIRMRGREIPGNTDNNKVELRPVFADGDGDNHIHDWISMWLYWTEWYDITSDTNAPSHWTWEDIVNLKCDVQAINTSSGNAVSMVQIRVSWDNETGDMLITGHSCVIQCWCSRWDVGDYGMILETWLNKSDLQSLRDSITPQAVGELFKILGRPHHYDTTWSGENTIELIPIPDRQLSNMRSKEVVFVKNITDSPVEGDKGWIHVKIECVASGSGDL